MSFSLANPTGWTTGDTLTETQINQIDAEHAAAIDGSGGGSYTLTSPLSISGDTVEIEDLSADSADIAIAGIASLTVSGTSSLNGNVTLGDNVSDNITAVGSLTSQNAFLANSTSTFVGASSFGSNVSVTGNVLANTYTGPLVSVDVVRALKHLRLSAGIGPAGTADLTVGGTNQMLYCDELSASTIYTILDTGAGDGNFFLIFNRSPGFVLTINAPIGTIATITSGNMAICWRSNSTWRGQVLSAT